MYKIGIFTVCIDNQCNRSSKDNSDYKYHCRHKTEHSFVDRILVFHSRTFPDR